MISIILTMIYLLAFEIAENKIVFFSCSAYALHCLEP